MGPEDIDLLVEWRIRSLESNVFDVSRIDIENYNSKIRRNTKDYYMEKLKSGGHIACFAFLGDEIVGCGGICIYNEMPSPDNLNGKCGYVMNIYTDPRHRGMGIATAVVKHLIKEAKTIGVEKIYLETSVMGRHIYEKIGFVEMHDYMKLM